MSVYEKIFNTLKDEESKKIYRARLVYSLLDDKSLMNSVIEEYERNILATAEWKSFLQCVINDMRPKVIFGCGAFGKKIYKYTKEYVKWDAFVDNNINSQGVYDDCRVLYWGDLNIAECEYAFYLPSPAYYGEMRAQLLNAGIPEDRIIDATIIFNLTEGKQYFDLSVLPHVENEVFVDGGAYDGMSAVAFKDWCGKDASKAFCFEPDSANVDKMNRNFSSRIDALDEMETQIVEKGLWDKNTSLSFVSQGNASSYIVEGESGTEDCVDVVSLDEFFGNDRVTFIKMDIEGSELKAIEGTRNIIHNQKPKLAICIYHKKEDIWEIPQKILEIRDDYNLYLRHYSFGMTETVLYCV